MFRGGLSGLPGRGRLSTCGGVCGACAGEWPFEARKHVSGRWLAGAGGKGRGAVTPRRSCVGSYSTMPTPQGRGGVLRDQWDYSISVTPSTYKGPILRAVEEVLEDEDWEEINEHEKAALITYRPSGWRREQTYVVVRQDVINGMKQLVPIYTLILVSRDDLELDEMVLRHRGKQGQENASKVP